MNSDAWNKKENMDCIINLYTKLVFGIALTHTQNRCDAEDVFQEVFLIYYRKKPNFHEEEHRKAWLIRTTINCSKRITQGAWRKNVLVDQVPEQIFEFNSELENWVYTAICQLPAIYKSALYLFYFEELSIQEISNYLKTKQGTIKVHLSRGRTLLREYLKGDYFYE